ncbi:ead/Ea22-like family protein [Salmonella enterica subsp. enterica]|nr:ead/Ea22-like family protein [Salmonella enterica subsp. enterica]
MTTLNKQALRETAVLADRLKIDRLKICGSTVLALLDELEAAERRVAELEARTVNLPAACADDEYFIDGVFQALRYERDVERAISAAGIKVKES